MANAHPLRWDGLKGVLCGAWYLLQASDSDQSPESKTTRMSDERCLPGATVRRTSIREVCTWLKEGGMGGLGLTALGVSSMR